MKTLPYNLYQLIPVALHDLELAEQSPNYFVNMNRWFHPTRDGYCHVCMAGAVLAFSLDFRAERYIWLEDIMSHPEKDKLMAIDSLRCGLVYDAVEKLHSEFRPDYDPALPMLLKKKPLPEKHPDLAEQIADLEKVFVKYETEPELFKIWCGQVATALAEYEL